MDITLEHPVYLAFLLLLPLLAAVHFYSLHYVRRRALRFANIEALEKIIRTKSVVPNNFLLLFMRMMVLVGFTLAAAGIVLHYEIDASSYDYSVAIDTSSSMLASDLLPDRISSATQSTVDWIGSLPQGSKVGVVGFSSQAEALSPLTDDLQAARAAAHKIVVGKSGGTALCEALKASTNQLAASANPKAIILLSDGQNNAGCLLDEGINYAVENGVTVFAIGVGNRLGGED